MRFRALLMKQRAAARHFGAKYMENKNTQAGSTGTQTVPSHDRPIGDAKAARTGASFLDARHYILSEPEREALLAEEPGAEKYIARMMTSRTLLRGGSQYCLSLGNCTQEELEALPKTKERVEAVREFRENDARTAVRDLAGRPQEFEVPPPDADSYIAIPSIMSKNYAYVPAAMLDGSVVPDSGLVVVPDGDLHDFGILASAPHAAWMRAADGHTAGTNRYSAETVYNGFPWPDATNEQRAAIEQSAKGILDARDKYPDRTLAELYDAEKMPEELRLAHEANDAAVKAAYGLAPEADDETVVAQLKALHDVQAKGQE